MPKDLDLTVNAAALKVERQVFEEPGETPDGGSPAVPPSEDSQAARTSGASLSDAPMGARAGRRDLAGLIDHTLLGRDASRDDLLCLCDEAREHEFASVCVNSANVALCKERLRGSEVMTVSVVGFPLGASSTGAKAYEARQAVRDGAEEIDMVINIGALRSRDYRAVDNDIRDVVEAAHPAPVKVILETGVLEHDEKIIACSLAKAAGAAFVKTSTGFGPGGATVQDVRLMRSVVGPGMGVKASGGVRDASTADQMIQAGATRIGASASVAIVTGETGKSGY